MHKYSKIIQTLLKGMGMVNDADIDAFINPSYDKHLHDPFMLNDMDIAVQLLSGAIHKNKKIAIYSDFDADGIPAAVILHDFFKKIDFNNFINYIPHRDKEGYGFHTHAVEELAKQGVDLIITVDVGIVAHDAVETANRLGMETIITDHHEPGCELPKAKAVINPKRVDSNYPFNGLCGAGVAFKVVQALINTDEKISKKINPGWEKWLLDMVAFATVADMVPLLDENRVLVYWGLRVLRRTRRYGLIALLNKLRISKDFLDENDIGYALAPRINAASRMGHPEDAFKLLTTTNIEEAENLADKLERLNNKRKGQVAAIVKNINKRIEASFIKSELPNVLVLGDTTWSPALVGLAAGSVADKLGKTVCVWGREGTGILKGSCRSGNGVNIVEMFKQSEEHLLFYGGHKDAGGFAVEDSKLHNLQDVFNGVAHEKTDSADDIKEHIILEVKDLNESNVNDIAKLSPFGIGNPRPVIRLDNIEIISVRRFGKEQNHIEIKFRNGKNIIKRATKFFADETSFRKNIVKNNQKVTLFVTVEWSSFAGRRSLELRIVDIA